MILEGRVLNNRFDHPPAPFLARKGDKGVCPDMSGQTPSKEATPLCTPLFEKRIKRSLGRVSCHIDPSDRRLYPSDSRLSRGERKGWSFLRDRAALLLGSSTDTSIRLWWPQDRPFVNVRLPMETTVARMGLRWRVSPGGGAWTVRRMVRLQAAYRRDGDL